MENQATAGLYNYTPYQPNTAALANLYGTGDSCSAYGNRNFWRMFYDWFGSTTGGVSLIKSSSSATIYVLYGNQKQPIASLDVLNAWGLNNLPVTVMDSASINVFPTRSVLTRLAHNPYNSALYFLADGGGTYDSLSNMAANWGYNPAAASDIGIELIAYTKRLGGLSEFVTAPNAGAIFTVDGGTRRPFANPDTFQTWAGRSAVNMVTTDLLSTLTSGTGLSSNQAQDGTSQYVLSMGKLLSLDNSIAALYPRTTVTTISSVLASILPTGGYASKFAKGPGATIYLVDGGTKHGIASLGLLMAYSSDAASTVTQFSDSELAQIPNGSAVTTRFAYNNTDASKQYYISSGTHATTATFGVAGYGFAISPAGLALFGQAKEPISCTQGLIQAQGSAGIYVLDNGVRRAIGSLNILSLIKNSAGNVCVLSPEDVAAMPLGTPISTFVSNGGINYLLDQNTRFTVTTAMATAIGAAEFVPVTATLLANYAEGGELTPNFKAGNYYVLTDAGVYHATTNPTIAKLWGLTDALQPHSADVLKFIVRGNDLSQYARSSDITVATIYLVDAGKFLPISALDHLFNAGLSSQPVTLVNTNILTANLGSSWQGYLASDSSAGTLYLLEGGKKHLIPPSLTSSWVGSSTPIVPTPLSPDFLSLLNTGSVATKSVETGAPGIYGIDNGKKAGIPNIKTYNALYAPSMVVTQQLINSIPYGPLITSQ
ncbi:MAG: hypothetical protein H7252_03970 [Cytophaga sp.]|nr:hypothetical protein [Undibacterium sp.]